MPKRIFFMWLTIVPLWCLLMLSESCTRYSTGPEWTWTRHPPRKSCNLPVEVPLISKGPSPFEGVLLEPEPEIEPEPTSDTHYRVYVVRARLTACSPQDRRDSRYYARHGYKGARYNVCFDFSVIPKHARVQIPVEERYMHESYPLRWWVNDAAGGPVIRRSTARGKVHGDVKYGTEYSADQFGNHPNVLIKVILPEGKRPSRVLLNNTVETYWLPKGSEAAP